MGLNFRKSINLGKGVKLNIGKKSVGVSAGVKGARVSMNSSGQKTATFIIPGTGLSYTMNLGKKKNSKKKSTDETTNGININLVLVIIILVLLVVLVGAGYAWYTGLI